MPGLDLGIDMGTSQVIIALPGRGRGAQGTLRHRGG